MIMLSFIVPFYGVEQYIEECIRSLYNQDIPQEEFEVICVDDCSPDGSRVIVERLQKEYPTLRLICHTVNKRQGGARNTGLREAKGRYIWFVDSDDYIKPNCLKRLLEQAEKENLDILQLSYFNKNEQSEAKDYGICTGSQYVFDLPLNVKPALRCCVVWNSIIKRDLLIRNNIWFAEHVQFEDDDYAYLMYAYAKRVCVVPHSIYISRYRSDSTTNSCYTLQKAKYYTQQVSRFIAIVPILTAEDARWKALIQDMIRWTCRDMILAEMHNLAVKDQRLFYKGKMGNIDGLWHWVPWKVWMAMQNYGLYKILK